MALALLLAPVPGAADAEDPRGPYLGLRLGREVVVDTDIAPGLGSSALHSLYGVSVGLDVGRHVGFELAADFFEPDLRASARFRPGQLGSVGELGT